MKKPEHHPFPVGFAVYELSRTMRRHFERRARSLGFTPEQWRALWHLERNEGITQAGLAEILEIQPISLTRTLDRMAASGLIERRPDPKDRRAVQLFLTQASEPILAMLHKEFESFRAQASEGMSPQQQTQMAALLGHMRDNLDKLDAATGGTPAKTAQG
jgi:MarR family transcriptional regulator for hemolysin